MTFYEKPPPTERKSDGVNIGRSGRSYETIGGGLSILYFFTKRFSVAFEGFYISRVQKYIASARIFFPS